MKILLAALLLACPQLGFAVSYPGVDKNVVMSCGSGDDTVWILSDHYTTAFATAPEYDDQKLGDDPGQMYTLRGKMTGEPPHYSIRTMEKMLPLDLTRATGWIDKTKGIYENDQYRLDLRSRRADKIILIDKAHDKELSCHVEGDCC